MRTLYLLAIAACALAQTPAPAIAIKTLDAVNRPDTLNLRIAFDSILDSDYPGDLTDSNITILAMPSASRLLPARIHATDTVVEITLLALPETKDTAINACFKTLHFFKLDDPKPYTSPPGKPICATAKLMTPADAKTLADQLNAAAAKAKADKTSTEKNIFASGFVTTAAASTQGGADISLNNSLAGLPGANAFLHLQKTSVSNGDLRHFELGLSFRHTTSFAPALDRKIVDDVQKFHQAPTEAARQALANIINTDAAKYGPWLGAIQAFAMKMEADPTHFKATNLVGDGDLRILTRTLKLFGSTNGYFRARPLIVGIEGGRSLGTGEPITGVNWIARGKLGADLTFFYDSPQAKRPIKRLELNAGGIERYLLFKEVNYDPATKKDSRTGKGSRPYFQSDLKLFFAQDTKARYGMRIAYTRGSLPPVFAGVKSFQFGIVFETTDDKAR